MDPLRLPLFLLFFVGICSCSNPDDALPVYLKGMNWTRVEEHAKEDLSLSDAVSPINYGIELSVNVRGHEGAERSEFNGTVYISLDIHRPINSVEVHSNGLIIDRADFIDIVIFNEPVGVSRISFDSERETLTVFPNRTIQPSEEFMLKITYRGVAKMDEYGLFESWDPKMNSSLDANGPFILASNNFPTGARTWFPCLDEPDKKATFDLQVTHPSGLNVYSNTEIVRAQKQKNGRTLSVFTKTRLLSTYQVALSINHLAVQSFDAKEFGTVRVISSGNSHSYSAHPSLLTQSNKERFLVDIVEYLNHNLGILSNTTLDVPKEKLEVIILEGTKAQFVHPGLMFIGRQKTFYSQDYQKEIATSRDFAQLLTRNRISVRNTNQMWMNHLFNYFLINETDPSIKFDSEKKSEFYHESLHERPLRDSMTQTTSTRQFLDSKNTKPAQKASQLLRLLSRSCPAFDKAMQAQNNKYFTDHSGGFADIDDFITTMTKSCPNPRLARAFLEDYIDQPGKPLLIVKRENDTVSIAQTRYHSTYFDGNLRDNKTRFTIPIRYKIEGKQDLAWFTKNETSLKITVPASSTFIIDYDLDQVYFVYYEDSLFVPGRKYSDAERLDMFEAAHKSLVSALAIGYATYDSVYLQLRDYVQNRVFTSTHPTNFAVISLDFPNVMGRHGDCGNGTPIEVSTRYRAEICERLIERGESGAFHGDWNGFYNNETTYWSHPARGLGHLEFNLECLKEFANSSSYERFLNENFLGDKTIIRPEQVPVLLLREILYQRREAHRFFFKNAANATNHRFNLLAEVILNTYFASGLYPKHYIRADYHRELREFVNGNPRRASSMITEIKTKLESEHMRCSRNLSMKKSWIDYHNELEEIAKKLKKD